MEEPRTGMALVVDDNQLVAMHAAEILENAGFRTFTAVSGDQAWEVIEASGNEITLLFTDVQMPGNIDGFLLARLTAKRWPSISILVASGDCRPGSADLPEGAVFIAKPFSAEVVEQRLHQVLSDSEKPEPLLHGHGN